MVAHFRFGSEDKIRATHIFEHRIPGDQDSNECHQMNHPDLEFDFVRALLVKYGAS